LVFGILIDVPLIVGGFLLMFRFRKQLTHEILRVKLPPLALYMILSVPLIIFEEQINCMQTWCGRVAIPPTLPFILIEMLALAGLVLWRHAKDVLGVTLFFSIFGVFWEIILGGLVGAPLVITAIFAPYVGISYAFISILPLEVLVEGKANLEDVKTSPQVPGSGAAGALLHDSSSL
jgi:hypothetical protein